MRGGLQIIGEYISKCASCPCNSDGSCGFVNDCNPEEEGELSLGHAEMMSADEIDLYNTRVSGTQCRHQKSYGQLMNSIELALEADESDPSFQEILKVMTSCHKYWQEVKRNDGNSDHPFNTAVEDGINIILSYLDLRCLEHGKDILPILLTYIGGYKRERGLDRYCPPSISSHYLQKARKYTLNGEVKESASVSSQSSILPKNETDSNLKDVNASALDQFLFQFTSTPAQNFVDAVLMTVDYELTPHYFDEPSHQSLFIYEALEERDNFRFGKWGDLRREISSRINSVKDDEDELDQLLLSLIKPAYNMKCLLHPGQKGQENAEADLFLTLLADTRVSSFDDFKTIWDESKAEATRYIDRFVGTKESYLSHIRELMSSKETPYLPECGCHESWAIFNINAALLRFASTIEGCLLENGIEKSFLEYQEQFQMGIRESFSDFDIAIAMDWSLNTVTYHRSITGHDIEEATPEIIKSQMWEGESYSQKYYEDVPLVPMIVELYEKPKEDSTGSPKLPQESSDEELPEKDDEEDAINVTVISKKKAYPSERMQSYIAKVSDLIIDDVWQGNVIKDYALFLKELYRVVYKKDGDFNVRWNLLQIFPMSDGKTPSNKQLSNAIRQFDSTRDAALIERYRKLLNAPNPTD